MTGVASRCLQRSGFLKCREPGDRTHPGARAEGSLSERPAHAGLSLSLVRPDVMDQIDGYRIYGAGANVLSASAGYCAGESLGG